MTEGKSATKPSPNEARDAIRYELGLIRDEFDRDVEQIRQVTAFRAKLVASRGASIAADPLWRALTNAAACMERQRIAMFGEENEDHNG